MKIEFYNAGTRSRLNVFMAALSGITVVLLLRRSRGIYHDALLYFAQSLLHYKPNIFSNDIFLSHGGGQSNYTIFPWLSGQLLHWFNPAPFFMVGALIGLMLFAAASWFFLKTILPEGQRYVPWMAILCFPTAYGYIAVFSYSEPFLTMRSFSEALCLFSAILLAHRRCIAALLLIVISGLLHPLQALTILPILWTWLVIGNKRWLHALWLIIPILIMAVAGVHPINGLFHKMDPFWLENVKQSPQLFITLWRINEFKYLAFDIFILLLALQRLPYSMSRWCQASLIALALGILGNLILVDWLHLALPAGLQIWRVHWLAHWFAMASIGLFLLEHWQAKSRQWPQAILLMLIAQLAWGEANWSWLGAAIIYLGWRPWIINESRARIEPLLGWLFGITWLSLFFINMLHDNGNINYYLELSSMVGFMTLVFGIVMFFLYQWKKATILGSCILGAILVTALLIGIIRWDERSEIMRYFDALWGQTNIFGVYIPENAQVFWDIEHPLLSWSILNRPHYYSFIQMAGQVFNRTTTVVGYDRYFRIKQFNDDLGMCNKNKYAIGDNYYCPISDIALYSLCKPVSSPIDQPPPDYFILPFNQDYPHLGQWSLYDEYNGLLIIKNNLYSCRDIMNKLPIKELEDELASNDD